MQVVSRESLTMVLLMVLLRGYPNICQFGPVFYKKRGCSLAWRYADSRFILSHPIDSQRRADS
jgi:hypothetical protein